MTYLRWIFLLNILFFISPALGNQLSYPGIVRIFIGDTEIGKGFFVTPTTLVTAFHVIEPSENKIGPIEDYLSFLDPLTKTHVPISEYLHLDYQYDLAHLRVKDYHSPTFYPIDRSPDKRRWPFKRWPFYVTIPVLKDQMIYGEVGLTVVDDNVYGEQAYALARLHINSRLAKDFRGFSGLPVFFRERGSLYVEGVVLSSIELVEDKDEYDLDLIPQGEAIFVSSNKLRDLFSKPELSCFDASCIHPERERVFKLARSGEKTAQFFLALELYQEALSYGYELHSSYVTPEERERIESEIGFIYRTAADLFFKSARQGHSAARYYFDLLYSHKLDIDLENLRASLVETIEEVRLVCKKSSRLSNYTFYHRCG